MIGHSHEIVAAYVAGAIAARRRTVVTLRKASCCLDWPARAACGVHRAVPTRGICWRPSAIGSASSSTALGGGGEVGWRSWDRGVLTKELRTRRIEGGSWRLALRVEVEAICGPLASSAWHRTAIHAYRLSTVTGNRLIQLMDADYWYRNVRHIRAIRPGGGAQRLRAGYRTFIESSPHPALITSVEGNIRRVYRR